MSHMLVVDIKTMANTLLLDLLLIYNPIGKVDYPVYRKINMLAVYILKMGFLSSNSNGNILES